MEENQMIQVQRPTQPEPWRDLDDLIFQGDGGRARDRLWAVSLSETALPFVEAEGERLCTVGAAAQKNTGISGFFFTFQPSSDIIIGL